MSPNEIPTVTIDRAADTVTLSGALRWTEVRDGLPLARRTTPYDITLPFSDGPFDPSFEPPLPLPGGQLELPGGAALSVGDPKTAVATDSARGLRYGLVAASPDMIATGDSPFGVLIEQFTRTFPAGRLDADQTFQFVISFDETFSEVTAVVGAMQVRTPIFGTDIFTTELYRGDNDFPATPVAQLVGAPEPARPPDPAPAPAADPAPALEPQPDPAPDASGSPDDGRPAPAPSPSTDGPTVGGADGPTVGGDGADSLVTDAGDDTVQGGAGDDTLKSGDGADEIDGGDGDDVILSGNDDDVIRGGAGNDNIKPGRGNDTVEGGDGDDVVAGFRGDERFEGGAGNDRLLGSVDDDTLIGGPGDDRLWGGPGFDVFVFGQLDFGTDTLPLDVRIGSDTLDFSAISGLTRADFSFRQVGSNVVAEVEGGGTLIMNGVRFGGLDAADFEARFDEIVLL